MTREGRRSGGAVRRPAVAALCCLFAIVAFAGVAAGAPSADAGLDQTVPVNTTVYLDGSGSSAPGGVAAVNWTVVAENGSTVPTSCPNCTRTQFTPAEPGRYTATLTVIGQSGATATDTLYVDVTSVVRPSVTIGGPSEPAVDDATTFALNVSAGDAPVTSVAWLVNGSRNRTISNLDDASTTVNHTFGTAGNTSVTAIARDEDGYVGRDSLNLSVRSGSASPVPYCGWAFAASEDVDPMQPCSDIFEGDLSRGWEGTTRWYDLDGDEDIERRRAGTTEDSAVSILQSNNREPSDTTESEDEYSNLEMSPTTT